MKNITVSVPDDVYRRARVHAAQEGKSLSALVAEFLERLSSSDNEFVRLEERQRQLHAEIRQFSGADRLSRDEVHERAVR